MSERLKAYGAAYTYPGKGHDRAYIDHLNRVYAVFDGAGGDELSDAAMNRLPQIIADNSHLRLRQGEFMARVVETLDALPEGLRRKSTMAMVCAQHHGDSIRLSYLNFGDSSIYKYDDATRKLVRIAHTDTEEVIIGGRPYVETSEFLGAGRDRATIARQIGELIMPMTARWAVMGFSDGIQDDSGRGISHRELREIAAGLPHSQMPDRILSSILPYDDEAVFVIGH